MNTPIDRDNIREDYFAYTDDDTTSIDWDLCCAFVLHQQKYFPLCLLFPRTIASYLHKLESKEGSFRKKANNKQGCLADDEASPSTERVSDICSSDTEPLDTIYHESWTLSDSEDYNDEGFGEENEVNGTRMILLAPTEEDAKRYMGRSLFFTLGCACLGALVTCQELQQFIPPAPQQCALKVVHLWNFLLPVPRERDECTGLRFVLRYLPGLFSNVPICYQGDEPIGIPLLLRF